MLRKNLRFIGSCSILHLLIQLYTCLQPQTTLYNNINGLQEYSFEQWLVGSSRGLWRLNAQNNQSLNGWRLGIIKSGGAHKNLNNGTSCLLKTWIASGGSIAQCRYYKIQ